MGNLTAGKPVDSVAVENKQLADARSKSWPHKNEHTVRGKQNKSVMSGGHGKGRKGR
jgi:hypothetical protein